MAADLKPWYLHLNYNQQEISIDSDNSVRRGTVPALVECLTAHDQGGKLFIIWELSIVLPFKGKALMEMPPTLIRDNLKGQVETVTAFAKCVTMLSTQDTQKSFQEVLLLSLNDSKVGLYSKFHDFSVWKYSYADPHSIHLAYM